MNGLLPEKLKDRMIKVGRLLLNCRNDKTATRWMCLSMLATTALLVGALLAAVGYNLTQVYGPRQEQPSGKKTVIAAVPRDFPPLYQLDNQGKPAGFAIDCLKQVAAESDLQITYRVTPTWQDTLNTLSSGNADLIPYVGVTADREKDFDFSQNYGTFALYLAFRKGTHAENQTLQGLDSRKKIGAVAGSPIEWLLHDQGKILPLIYFSSIEKALEALAAGQIDTLAHPISALKAGITKMRLEETLVLSDAPITEISHAIAVRKADKALLSRINPAIIHFRRSEEHAAIYRYWFGQPYSFWTPRRVFLVMIIVLLLLIWATIFWSYRHLLRINSRLNASLANQKLAENALRAEREMFISGPVVCFKWVNAPGWPLEYASPNVLDVYGYPAQEMTSGKINYIDVLYPEDVFRVTQDLERHDNERVDVFEQEYRIVKPDGQIRWVCDFSRALRGPEGKITSYHGYCLDITDRKTVEARLKESETNYRMLFDMARDAVFLHIMGKAEKEDRLVAVNNTACKMLGYTRSEIFAVPPYNLIAEKDLARFKHLRNELLGNTDLRIEQQNKTSQCLEFSMRRKDGTCMEVELNTNLFRYRGQLAAISIIRDITERKRILQQLLESEERYRRLFDMAVDAIFLHEISPEPGHGKFIDANPTACKILGYRRKELLEMCPADIISEESQHTIGTMRQELERDRFSLREIVIRTRTGARIIFETMMHFFELGRRPVVMTIARNITQRKKVEAEIDHYRMHLEELVRVRTNEIAQVNEFNRSIISTIPSSIAVVDHRLTIISANRRFCELFRVSYEQIILSNLEQLMCFPGGAPESSAFFQVITEKSPQELPTEGIEIRVQIANGAHILHVRTARLEDNVRRMILLVIEDVTKNKTLEQHLILSEKLAATGRLAASVAHEINNPLQGITTHLDILQQSLPAAPEIQESTELITENLHRIRDIVRQLLDIHRGPGGNKNVLDLNELAEKVANLVRKQFASGGVELDLRPNRTPARILGWAQQLHQVILNLILNALDHTSRGGKVIVAIETDKNTVKLSVTDTGKGINAQDLARIFDPFFTTKPGDGVGLGLFVCQELVNNHGGSITVDSRPGQGSVFTVTLPESSAARP